MPASGVAALEARNVLPTVRKSGAVIHGGWAGGAEGGGKGAQISPKQSLITGLVRASLGPLPPPSFLPPSPHEFSRSLELDPTLQQETR